MCLGSGLYTTTRATPRYRNRLFFVGGGYKRNKLVGCFQLFCSTSYRWLNLIRTVSNIEHYFSDMRTWSNYGKWRHPIQYHQIKLDYYFKVNYPDQVKLNPTVIHVEDGYIHYRMMNQRDQIRMSIILLD